MTASGPQPVARRTRADDRARRRRRRRHRSSCRRRPARPSSAGLPAGGGVRVRAHQPLTAPATRPPVIRPCTMRKKMTTGMAIEGGARHHRAPVRRRASRSTGTRRSHIGSVRLWPFMSTQRERELVPRLDEGEDAGGDEAGREQREGDPPERLRLRCSPSIMAASSRSAGTPGDESAQRPDREGDDRRDVDDAEAQHGVHQAPVVDHAVDREHHRLAGDHLDDEHRDDERRADRGSGSARRRPRRGTRTAASTTRTPSVTMMEVGERVREVGLPGRRLAGPRGDVVLPREVDGKKLGLAADDLVRRGERHVHHPVDGEDRREEDDDGRDVEERPGADALPRRAARFDRAPSWGLRLAALAEDLVDADRAELGAGD